MQAIRQARFGGPEVLVLEDLPTPVPASGEVLVRVHAASINHYDILSRRGDFADVPLPRIPGMECSGHVEAYGGGSRTDLAIGTPVVVLGTTLGNGGPGGYSTHVCLSETEVFAVPAGLDLTIAACLGMTYLTAWYALIERAQLQPEQTLLIPGAGGGVAGAVLEIAVSSGARVAATSGGAAKCARAVSQGAQVCVDYHTQDVTKEILAWSGGQGVELVLDAVGGDSIQQGLNCLASRGRLLSIGIVRGNSFSVDAVAFLSREQFLLGVNAGQLAPAKRYAIFEQLADWIAAGKLTVTVDRTFPLAEAADAHRYAESGERYGKLILLCD
ncbi:quinone oxidoreductase family protein [Gloeobacter kilaueensis]|uniref:Alcohol dehydrogenase n=1 Tax=Gloeobacter kilaueensis (strain ATCC BAA-2537 / CCAP 1431/1 / ULC 316 / JS1) TaxID=1183438 RepID=U5QIW9_GLOK1|nr:zinc-binding dehydrogenase [Gloeobacter kilaueensis]AGY58846.1 alcohol dehydrogenase [Gloeobacter kilaueensis JS1]